MIDRRKSQAHDRKVALLDHIRKFNACILATGQELNLATKVVDDAFLTKLFTIAYFDKLFCRNRHKTDRATPVV